MTQSYVRNIVRSGSRPVRQAAQSARDQRPRNDSMPAAETAAQALFPFSDAHRRFTLSEWPRNQAEAGDAPGSVKKSYVKEKAEERVESDDAADTDGGSRRPHSAFVPNARPVPEHRTSETQADSVAHPPVVPDTGSAVQPAAANASGQANRDDTGASDDAGAKMPQKHRAGSAPVVTENAGKESGPEDDNRMQADAKPARRQEGQPTLTAPRETAEPIPKKTEAAAGATSTDDTGKLRQPPASAQRSSRSREADRSAASDKATSETHAGLDVFYVTPRQAAPGSTGSQAIPENPGKRSSPAEGLLSSPLRERAVPDTGTGREVLNETPRRSGVPEKSQTDPARDNAGDTLLSRPKVSKTDRAMEAKTLRPKEAAVLDNAQSISSAAQARGHDRLLSAHSGSVHHSALPAFSGTAHEPGVRETPAVRPREQAQLPPAGGGIAPSRRDEGGPRITINRLDVQFITRKQPEPPRQAPPQPVADLHDAWNAVDRHYLHHFSVNL